MTYKYKEEGEVVRTLILCDVDEVLRPGKQPVSADLIDIISYVRRIGVHVGMITGGALSQLPDIAVDLAFAESGGVMRLPDGNVRVNDQLNGAIAKLDQFLGLRGSTGWQEPPAGGVILEEERFSGRTFLFGSPPHYPGLCARGSLEDLYQRISDYITQNAVRLMVMPGVAQTYRWLDVISVTKEETLSRILHECSYDKIYYLGDGPNDLVSMQLPGIVPVGFANSIAAIREIAQARGEYIPLPGPEGGSYEFFRRIRDGEL